MPKINLLDELTANQIAAGEVIERPASAVKELVENALDAGAANISVEIKNGGLSLIRVSDDGEGMSETDVKLAVKRHATSKITAIHDLESLTTLGFRGEALPSIVSVAKVEICTREAASVAGTRVYLEGNQLLASDPAGCPAGTTVSVRDLFYNTPARRKFLRSEGYESGLIHELMIQFALGHPQVNFRLIHQDKEILNTTGITALPDLLIHFFGDELQGSLLKVSGKVSAGYVEGYLTIPTWHKANRKTIHFFLNKRKVLAKELLRAVETAYENLLPSGRFPLAVLNISLPPALLDVNVHPGKLEVKIRDLMFGREMGEFLRRQIQERGEVPDYSIGSKISDISKATLVNHKKISFPAGEALSVQESFHEFFPFSQEKSSCTDVPIIPQPAWPEKSIPFKPTEHAEMQTDKAEADTSRERQVIDSNFEIACLRVIGQFKNTFILAEGEDSLYVIDQHVAHERVIFDKLLREAAAGKLGSQVLLNPVTLKLSLFEEEILLEHILTLTDLGLIIEHFGPRTYLLRAVPAGLQDEPQEYFFELLQKMEEAAKQFSGADLKKEFILITSCKSAIKANQKLTDNEIKQLLADLARTENPFTCPHGRPVVYKISHRELLKAFQRI